MSLSRRILVAFFAVGGTFLVSSLVLTVLLFTSKGRTRDAATDIKGKRGEILEAKQAIARIPSGSKPAVEDGVAAISKFQAALEEKADQKGCHVLEYSASDQVAGFLTHYEKDTKEKDWQQIDVRASLEGTLDAVMGTLASLADSPVPIEIDSIETARTDVDSKGNATVTANLQLRVLTKGKENAG